MLLSFLLFYKPIIVESGLAPAKKTVIYCCSIEQPLENVSIFKKTNSDDEIISIDPTIQGAAQISSFLDDNGFKYTIGSLKTSYLIANKSFQHPDYHFLPLNESNFDILKNFSINYDVYSYLSCFDSYGTCKVRYPIHFNSGTIMAISVFLVIGLLAYKFFSIRKLPDNVFICDKNLKPVVGSLEGKNAYCVDIIKNDTARVIQTNSSQISIIRMERSISSYNFDLCITFKLDSKTERVMNILMKEEFSLPSDEKLPIDVNLESTDQSVLQSSEVHLKTFREFRPVRIKIELSTGQRGYYELPVGVITPMNPLSHLFSIITSIFLDCYNFITTSPFSEENVKIILDKYMPMLGANQAFFLDKYENLFLCHTINNEPLINIDLLRSVLHKNSNSMFFETNEIEGVKSIFRTSTNSTDTQLHIVFCFTNPLMEHFSQVGLPIVALCTTFVYQLSLLHRTSQKYTSLIDMLSKSNVFSIYKYYKLEGRLEKNSPEFVEILTQQEAREIASVSKPGELNIWHGKNKIAYTFTSSDGATINILAENTEPINRQITDVSAGLDATYAFSGQLNYAKLDLSETPKLYDGEEFLKKYGLSPDKPFIEHVHINDREKLLAIGREMPAHGGSDFISNSVQSITDLNGSEQRYFIPETLLSSSIDPERSKNFMFEYKPDNCSIRLIDSHGFAHWFIVYGNHDIGFIFDAGDFLSTLIPPIPLRALSNSPSTVTIWGVVIETDQVVSVFEMPTIWDALSIDKDTPFSYFPKFFRDPSPEIEQRIQDVRDGIISSYSAVVQILRPGSILRKGRLSVAKYGSSLICAFFDLEEYRETYQRVHEQCQLKSFLIKVGQVAVWRFNDSYDKTAQNKLIIGESKLLTLNWGFVDNELDDENTKVMFTTRMRNAMDLGHAFEIDLQIHDGRYFAFRGRTTAPHVVTGLLVDVTKVYSSPCNRLVNGKTDVEETVKAISEIKNIFQRVDRSKLSNEQISNVDEVIRAAADLEDACRGLK